MAAKTKSTAPKRGRAPSPETTDKVAARAFDPGSPAAFEGIYGLPYTVSEAQVVVIPVPWDATTSYRSGTSNGPAAVLSASRQVDLFDLETGRPYESGIAMLPMPRAVVAWNTTARRFARPVIAAGGAGRNPRLRSNTSKVNELGARLNEWVRSRTAELLDQGKMVVVLGGDHSTPFGAFQAYAERHPGIGILHIDAHYDLRDAYEGFAWSHASIMHNALERIPGIERIVHVGIRDCSEAEHAYSAGSGGRSIAFHDATLKRRTCAGDSWDAIAHDIVEKLPREVFVSFDIDGLDPVLCPGTGTPVPGGLAFHQATSILAACVVSGRQIVGCDLNEVAPRKGDGEWNANVGARLLYKMIGYALKSQR